MLSYYRRLHYKNQYRQQRLKLGHYIALYLRNTYSTVIECSKAGYIADVGYVKFKDDPKYHRVRMTYREVPESTVLVIKIVFEDTREVKLPIFVRIPRQCYMAFLAFSNMKMYAKFIEDDNTSAAVDFITY